MKISVQISTIQFANFACIACGSPYGQATVPGLVSAELGGTHNLELEV